MLSAEHCKSLVATCSPRRMSFPVFGNCSLAVLYVTVDVALSGSKIRLAAEQPTEPPTTAENNGVMMQAASLSLLELG